MSSVLRGGRLSKGTSREVVEYISSFDADRRISRSIVRVNRAHVAALLKARLVSTDEARKLVRELKRLENTFPSRAEGEDYHLYIEQQLTKRLGLIGEKLHTGKSRNDQVATAIRLTLRDELLDLSTAIIELVSALVRQAEKNKTTFFVGYTHMQPAQPITYGHYLLSLADALLRDDDRVLEAYHRVNLSPMGSAALAGSSFNLDRKLVSDRLGFEGLVENSLDGVGSRDFLLEPLGVCVVLGTDLARIAEDLIFYGSSDVNQVEIPEEYSSTSSIMPQKKNPDPLEIVRAQCGEIIGSFVSAASILHALPSGYNLDFQQLTPLVWSTLDRLGTAINILTGMVGKIKVVKAVSDRYQIQFTTATELANGLVRLLGLSFREAHRSVGHAVRLALENQRGMSDLSLEEWNKIVGREIGKKNFEEMKTIADPRKHSEIYQTRGSPRLREVERMLQSNRNTVRKHSETVEKLRSKTVSQHGGERRIAHNKHRITIQTA